MCIIVDPPLFISMFKTSDPYHADFVPVKKWVDDGHGKFVIGGEKYRKEIFAVRSVLPMLLEYERRGRIVRRPDAVINEDVVAVKLIEPCTDFDDPHLVALVRASGCKLICVRDARAHKYLRAGKFYPTLRDRPKLYTRASNSNLLCASNIAACCK